MLYYSIYIIDDEKSLAQGLAAGLKKNYRSRVFANAEDGLSAINAEPPDLVLLDIGLPGMDGVEALREIKKIHPEIVVIMITAFEDVETVISAMRHGAYDYVVKPIHMDSLKVSIKNGLESIRLRKEIKELQEEHLKENTPFFIGKSRAIQDVIQLVDNIGESSDTAVLVLGESGTGKEIIAKAIHYRSPNFRGPLVTVNCAAIPQNMVESELFGYEKGAFTGASATGKKGLVEQAVKGTLFLDEIGDLSLEAQAKLLRFLETGEFYRIGGTQERHVQTRIISASNRNLEKMIEQGLFREDLYFRISVVKLEIPSLNERPDDILLMAKFFLVEFNGKFSKNFIGFTPQAETALQKHHWRGNVRELKNMIERGTLLGKGPELTPLDLGFGGSTGLGREAGHTPSSESMIPPQGVNLDSVLEEVEKKYIQEAIKISNGNETKAADLLNMKYTTLRYRRKKLDIPN